MISNSFAPKTLCQQGFALIEVLVTIIVLVFGLLGLAGLQAKSHTLEFESYQRAQTLVLLQDMVDRMNGNAADLASYSTGTGSVGTGKDDSTNCAGATRALKDLCDWSRSLKGFSEVASTDGTKKQGGAIDARGCVIALNAATYLVSVAWQGMSTTVPPITDCGSGSYDSLSSRRAVTAVVQVPDLGAN